MEQIQNYEQMNIYQKMLLVTEKINRVAKNLKVGVGGNQYKAVGEADVLEAVKPVEVEVGIYSYPLSRSIIDTNVFVTKNEYNGKVTEKNNVFMRLETVYRFVNTDKPDEHIDITTYGDGVDSQDKAPGKAMTYSDKYALLKAYKIETGDDPDQNASQDGKMQKPSPSPSKPKAAAKEETDKPDDQIGEELVNKNNIDALEMRMKKKGVTALQICSRYKVNTLEEMTLAVWNKAMNALSKTADVKQTDLGL